MKYEKPEMEIILVHGEVIVSISNGGTAEPGEGGGIVNPPSGDWS